MSQIKIATKVERGWLNKQDMSASLGISVQAFDKWDVEPVARVGRSVYFCCADVVANRINCETRKQPTAPKRQAPNGDFDEDESLPLDYEKYRLTKAQADAQELKNEVNRQVLIPVEFATFALSSVAAEVSGVIDSLPLNIVRKHPELTRIQQENIKRELSKGMNAMSRFGEKLPDYLDEFIKTTNQKF